MANRRLEEYLASVERRLKTLPVSERKPQIAELRQHLESIIAADPVQGVNEEIAAVAAIQQFDGNYRLVHGLNTVGLRARIRRLSESVLFAALVAGLTAALFWYGSAYAFIWTYFTFYPVQADIWLNSLSKSEWHLFYSVVDILALATAGWVTGKIAPRQSVLGVIIALPIAAYYLNCRDPLTWTIGVGLSITTAMVQKRFKEKVYRHEQTA